MRARKMRVQHDCPFEEALCPLIVGGGKAIKVLQPQMINGPGIQRVDRGHLCAAGLVQRNVNIHRRDKTCDDAVAKIVDCIKRSPNGGGISYMFIINGLRGDIFGVRASVFLMSF